jgi:amino acid transporter
LGDQQPTGPQLPEGLLPASAVTGVRQQTDALPPTGLQRHLGLFQATAINVTMVVGAGVFITIPTMLGKLPGGYALLGWLAAGVLILVDCLVWSELGAAFPGSGGSYVYLLQCYGPKRWGRLMAFLFIWQFLLSGPLEIASGLIAADTLSQALDPGLKEYNDAHTTKIVLYEWKDEEDHDQTLNVTFSPVRWAFLGVGALCVALLYRRVTSLGRLAVVFWICILAAVAWILIEGYLNFDARRAFDFNIDSDAMPKKPFLALGQVMILAIYSYIGYYNICYMGDEVLEPGRNIPRSILLSTLLVIALFVGLHLAMLGTVPWAKYANKDDVNLAAVFMEQVHGPWAAKLVTLMILGSIFASAFSGMLGYSRIPYGASRAGHFFAAVGRVHPDLQIPHISLLLVGAITLFWTLFDFTSVLNALITTRLLVQFVGQNIGLMLLRRARPHGPWPFRMWLYPIPCGLALVGWLYLFASSGMIFIGISLVTMLAGTVAFFIWSASVRSWPFGPAAEA